MGAHRLPVRVRVSVRIRVRVRVMVRVRVRVRVRMRVRVRVRYLIPNPTTKELRTVALGDPFTRHPPAPQRVNRERSTWGVVRSGFGGHLVPVRAYSVLFLLLFFLCFFLFCVFSCVCVCVCVCV